MWRVNYSNGQVSETFNTKKAAQAHIAEANSRNDPYAGLFYIQKQVEPGFWVKVR